MTKCIVLGEQSPIKEKKCIKFERYLVSDHFITCNKNTNTLPEEWLNIELVKRGNLSLDIMYAYNNDRDKGCLYLGYWNDEIV